MASSRSFVLRFSIGLNVLPFTVRRKKNIYCRLLVFRCLLYAETRLHDEIIQLNGEIFAFFLFSIQKRVCTNSYANRNDLNQSRIFCFVCTLIENGSDRIISNWCTVCAILTIFEMHLDIQIVWCTLKLNAINFDAQYRRRCSLNYNMGIDANENQFEFSWKQNSAQGIRSECKWETVRDGEREEPSSFRFVVFSMLCLLSFCFFFFLNIRLW